MPSWVVFVMGHSTEPRATRQRLFFHDSVHVKAADEKAAAELARAEIVRRRKRVESDSLKVTRVRKRIKGIYG